MTAEDILGFCIEELDGVVLIDGWGERCVFFNPEKRMKRGVYVLTVKEKDGENDKSSELNRDKATYRVNLGARGETFAKLFGELPKRPAKGRAVDMDYDFTSTNQILPHPVYAWMGWICSINPSEDTFERLKPFILEAYEYAKEKYERNIMKANSKDKNGK